MDAAYDQPSRGTADAYARYLAGMDASMRQKVALTAAHFLGRGRVADMGMGSGAGTEALAALYPGLEVVGVDVDPRMVALARARFDRPNLRFEVGDIAAPVFEDGSLDGILDSSVLHHVTSYGGYRHARALEAIAVQARALRPHGVLVVRDFVAPEDGEAPVVLELPAEDGADDPAGPVAGLSTAALLLRFAREFRSLSAAPGFPCEELPRVRAGWRRFGLSHRHAVEFLLRKDYRDDWAQEVQEEYTWATQHACEAHLARLGLRLLASTPIRNPWVVAHRWAGRAALHDRAGRPMEFPPTNYLVAGERVGAGEGVRFRAARADAPARFLDLVQRARVATGAVYDVARRPGLTVDVLAHFDAGGETFVLARRSYPRPLLALAPSAGASLDGWTAATYVTEPLTAIQAGRPLATTVEELLARSGVGPGAVRRFRPGATYWPTPGGVEEEVRSVLVEIAPTLVTDAVENVTGFSSAGRVRAIEARQVLRAAQVGGLADARLEMNVYELLLALGREPGPWIGAELDLGGAACVEPTPLAALLARPPRRAFAPAPPERSPGFLELAPHDLTEESAGGPAVAARRLEAVLVRGRSMSTVAAAVLARDAQGRVLLGLDDDDLPAAQGFTGHSGLLVAPAWRLPEGDATPSAARRFVGARLAAEHGVAVARVEELGGRYHPTPGATPEVVHPWAVVAAEVGGGARPLAWVALEELCRGRAALTDGHLRVVALRAAHALGLLAAPGARAG